MDISRQTLFGKLNPTLFKSLESATAFCRLRGNTHVELLHWLHQLLQGQDNDIARILRHCGVDSSVLDQDLAQGLTALRGGAGSVSDFSAYLVDAVERAWVYATLAFGDNRIRGAWLVAALAGTPELRRILLSISAEFKRLPVDDFAAILPTCIAGSPESSEQAADGSDLGIADDAYATPADPMGPRTGQGNGLERFCTDLTRRARDGQLDPVVGRDLEIRAMIDILLRRRQNNPLLTGDAGVGKTAIVEGLALALAQGDVPPALRTVRLLTLDVGALLAGAGMKGEFESRLKGVIEDAARSPQPVIIFVDEIHTLVGAGGTQGTGDAANLLKPALARGTLRTIGATTWSEYKKHIEKDPALTRRFQVLQVQEPDESAAVEMVRGLVKTFREHHKVAVPDEAVRAAVRLSSRYIPARQLPDKAISLLDTACARVALSHDTPPPPLACARRRLDALLAEEELLHREQAVCVDEAHPRTVRLAELATELLGAREDVKALEADWQAQREAARALIDARETVLQEGPQAPSRDTLAALENALAHSQRARQLVYPEVSAGVVAEIVADWTGIPVGRMMRDELKSVIELSEVMSRRIMGQDHALDVLARRIQSSRALLTDPGKPVGVFLLAGPSGVGKTETALALAEALYGGEQNLIAVNMSEFQEAHTVSTLKGAPPGYVGYGEGGVLTEAVRRRPHSVILLDEIEKAHQDVYEIFYQVFDKGWMEDGEGRYIDFRNTVILLTTNVGSDRMAALCHDPDLIPEPEALTEALLAELRKVFPAAFLGRLSVVPYLPLDPASLHRIVEGHLGRLRERLQLHHGIPLDCDEALVPHIIERCAVAETGARLLIGFIEQRILPEVGRAWLSGMADGRAPVRIRLAVENDRPVCLCSEA